MLIKSSWNACCVIWWWSRVENVSVEVDILYARRSDIDWAYQIMIRFYISSLSSLLPVVTVLQIKPIFYAWDPWKLSCDSIAITSNERHGDSNHRHLDCLFNNLLRQTSRKTSKPSLLALCEGNRWILITVTRKFKRFHSMTSPWTLANPDYLQGNHVTLSPALTNWKTSNILKTYSGARQHLGLMPNTCLFDPMANSFDSNE